MSASQNGNEQMSTLGKMVLQKLDELRQLDTRIDQRIEQLNRADSSLRVLFDSLRTSVLQAHPLIGQMNDLRQGSAAMLETLVNEVKARVAADPVMIASPRPDVSRIEKVVADGVDRLDARSREIDGELAATIETAHHSINAILANVQRSAGETMAALQARLEEVQATLAELAARGDLLSEKSSLAETHLDDAIAAFSAQADSTIAAVRRSVAQQVEQLSAQARLDVRPILSQVDESRRAAEAQLATAVESAEQTLERRADELKRGAERMIELCERQLVDRIANIRPRTRAAVESIEHAANQRLTAAMDEMQKAIDRAEAQSVERLDALRPRFGEMMMQLERDIREQSKRMEEDAIAGVHWLEHRLQARVDEVSAKIDGVLRCELDHVDQQLQSQPHRPRPASPVQVRVMTDELRQRNGESASAA